MILIPLKYILGGYAHFDNNRANRLVFNPEALEGKGKQEIKIKVSAKYPRYEGMSRFTTQEVTIKAIYGVSVYNVGQLRRATKMQREYIQFDWFRWDSLAYDQSDGYYSDKNIQAGARIFEHTVVNGDESVTYATELEPTALRTKAVVLMANCNYGEGVDTDNLQILESANDRCNIFGDLYGNNHMISALQGQMNKNEKLIRVSWSGVVVSNVIVRANDLGDNANISTDETKTFVSSTVEVGSHHNWNRYHLTDIKFEYSILENGREATNMFNADVTFDGCVIRNFISAGIYVPQTMHYDSGLDCWFMYYGHLTLNNVTCSNMIASLVSGAYENFSIDEDGNNRFVKDGTTEENNAYFMEHFYPYGCNFELKQTGFFDAYNWQNVNNASIIDTGNETANKLIGSAASEMLTASTSFDKFICATSDNEQYYHLVYLVSGINLSNGVKSEPTFANVQLQDSRLDSVHLGSIDTSAGGLVVMAQKMLSTMYMYGYNNEANIKPNDTYVINSQFIERLH